MPEKSMHYTGTVVFQHDVLSDACSSLARVGNKKPIQNNPLGWFFFLKHPGFFQPCLLPMPEKISSLEQDLLHSPIPEKLSPA
jgi:hypothetical protein